MGCVISKLLRCRIWGLRMPEGKRSSDMRSFFEQKSMFGEQRLALIVLHVPMSKLSYRRIVSECVPYIKFSLNFAVIEGSEHVSEFFKAKILTCSQHRKTSNQYTLLEATWWNVRQSEIFCYQNRICDNVFSEISI